MRPTPPPDRALRQGGFTLVEAVMVIALTGILAGMVAVFLRGPVEAYVDTARRAELTDVADTALRRVSRDIQNALPNSVRVNGDVLEFIPIAAAGRYRAEAGTQPECPTGAPACDDSLDFTSGTDAAFDVLGPPVTIPNGASIVVYNLGIPGTSSAYDTASLTSRRLATAGANLTRVAFAATGTPFPLASPGSRFQVVTTPVAYVCDTVNRQLLRFTGYPIQELQPASVADLNALGAVGAVVARDVATCAFSYNPGLQQRDGLVSLQLALSSSGETVNLMHQVNVDNTP